MNKIICIRRGRFPTNKKNFIRRGAIPDKDIFLFVWDDFRQIKKNAFIGNRPQ